MNTLTKTPTVEFMLESNMLPEALAKIIGDIMIPAGLNIGFIGGFNSGPKFALKACARRGLKEDAPILTNIDLDYEEFKQAVAFSEFKLDEELKPHHIIARLKRAEILEITELTEENPGLNLLSLVYADSVEDFRFKVWKMFAIRGATLSKAYLDLQISKMCDLLIFFKNLGDGQRVLDSVIEVGNGDYRPIYSFDHSAYERGLIGGNKETFRWKFEQYISDDLLLKMLLHSKTDISDDPMLKMMLHINADISI